MYIENVDTASQALYFTYRITYNIMVRHRKSFRKSVLHGKLSICRCCFVERPMLRAIFASKNVIVL